MRWGDLYRVVVAIGLCVSTGAHALLADQSTYGKVDTFEPGKKYNCVPTADRKGWDCTQTGKVTDADTPAPATHHEDPAPAAPANPQATAAPAPAAHTGTLPSYLLAQPGANEQTKPQAPATVAAPAPAAAAPAIAEAPAVPGVHTSTNPQIATPAAAPPGEVAVKPTPTPAAEPVSKAEAAAKEPATTAAPAPPAAVATPEPAVPAAKPVASVHPQASNGGNDFLALSGDQYVIELAHASSESDIAAIHASLQLPHGAAYQLHLRQNGADNWLLVWGSFDDVGSARAARAELSANASVTPGWPRRIAPLQAEVRRTQE